MPVTLTSFQTVGLRSERIDVEVGIHRGESKTRIVGLGDTAVKESSSRVWSALRSSNYHFPPLRIITVNLAPADLRKAGPRYDLAIALGMLHVYEHIDLSEETLRTTAFLGELALDGTLRHVTGVLSAAIACRDQGMQTLVVPESDAAEAALIEGITVIPAQNLRECIGILQGVHEPSEPQQVLSSDEVEDTLTDFADVRGQTGAKRALEIAAAGGHNVLLSGAPGAGKTLLARALPTILPPLSMEESIDVSQIYSVANKLQEGNPLIRKRPFRIIHHTASGVSIVGGGNIPRPGEISLAHHGVLFLDELAEFPTNVLEVLRQPLEDRSITITRAQGSVTFPADFILVAAMNPPEYGGSTRRKLSAPFLDRIDLKVNVEPGDVEDLERKRDKKTETSAQIRERISRSRAAQAKRFADHSIRTNAEMNVRQIDTLCAIDAESKGLLRRAAEKVRLSARGYHRTIKVARTIADLEGLEHIGKEHVAEALQYRQQWEE